MPLRRGEVRHPARQTPANSLIPIVNDPERRALFELKPTSNSNVDWPVQLYALDPSQFPDGLADVARLTPGDNPRKLGDTPVQIGLVRAELESKTFNVPELIASLISKALFSSTDPGLQENQFRIQSLPPGVYVSEAYSGNLWYGTRFFLPETAGLLFPNNQATTIELIGGEQRFNLALAGNLVSVAVDAASVLLPLDAVMRKPEAIHKLLRTVYNDVTKLLWAATGNRTMDMETAYDVVRTATTAVVKGLVELGFAELEKGESFLEKLGRYAQGSIKFVAKSINVLKKVSSGPKAAERTSGLVLPSTLALERSVLVVGDPFEPVITSFSPQQGIGGDLVILQGKRFPTDQSQLKASFCEFASTANPNASTTNLSAEILQVSADSMTLVVPTYARSVFRSGKAFICVQTPTKTFDTTGLPADAREFTFDEPIRLQAVVNNPVPPGGIENIQGGGFPAPGRRPIKALLDGNDIGLVLQFADSNALVQLPRALKFGNHTLALRAGAEPPSDPVPLVVGLPSAVAKPGDLGPKLEIRVSRLDMSNVADGEISLLDAFLIASGKLGRPIELRRLCEQRPADDPDACPYVRREIDNISVYTVRGISRSIIDCV